MNLILALRFAVVRAEAPLQVIVQADASFSVRIGNSGVWLASPSAANTSSWRRNVSYPPRQSPQSPFFMWVDGKLNPVVVQHHTKGAAGTSATLGGWVGDLFTCTAGGVRVDLAVKTYGQHVGVATFETTLPNGANGKKFTRTPNACNGGGSGSG